MTLPIVHHAAYTVPLPHRHRFPMNKYRALMELLREDGLAQPGAVHEPDPAPRAWLELAHAPGYVQAICERTAPEEVIRRIGLPLSQELVERSRFSTGGSVLAGRLALARGLACQTAGGSHHAAHGHGAGYCVFNDVAVACRVLQEMGLARNILIVDLDVHQGDGTAAIFAGDDSVFTFSMHCEKNFPVRKQPGDLDIGLPEGMGDDAYLGVLAYQLDHLLDGRSFDLVFYNAGVDPHADDRLGKLALSDQGLADRDDMVIAACLDRGLPLACVIGGGYDNDVFALARRHALLHRAAIRRFRAIA
jgi:acetoin utilization deacetylase AcuC-like enzyme